MTTVVNKHSHHPTPNDVYIGRGSKWGNPFIMGKHGDRDDVVRLFACMIVENTQRIAMEIPVREPATETYFTPLSKR